MSMMSDSPIRRSMVAGMAVYPEVRFAKQAPPSSGGEMFALYGSPAGLATASSRSQDIGSAGTGGLSARRERFISRQTMNRQLAMTTIPPTTSDNVTVSPSAR